jgi:hypothetical protein
MLMMLNLNWQNLSILTLHTRTTSVSIFFWAFGRQTESVAVPAVHSSRMHKHLIQTKCFLRVRAGFAKWRQADIMTLFIPNHSHFVIRLLMSVRVRADCSQRLAPRLQICSFITHEIIYWCQFHDNTRGLIKYYPSHKVWIDSRQ